MTERFLRMTRKWLEGAAGLRLEAMTQSFTKSTGKRADELIRGSVSVPYTAKRNKKVLRNVCVKAVFQEEVTV